MIKEFFASLAASLLAITPISWGLGHNGNEQLPTIPDGCETLFTEYNGLYRVNTDEKKVFLTFDLGYEAGYTAQILDTLKLNNLKAIFFLCGNYLNETELVNRMINEGHMIGNHTDKHKDPTKLDFNSIQTDITVFQNEFMEKFPNAKAPIFYRPPQGKFDVETLQVAKANNLQTMLWGIAIKDWEKAPINPDKSSKLIAKRIHPGAIVLLHIANSGMPKTVEMLLPLLNEKGYQVGNPFEI